MSKKVQRQYSAELKASAVKMVIEELKTLSQVSQDLHIPLQTLHSWVNKGRKGELSGVGTYNPDLVALQTEVRQLKKQLAAALRPIFYCVDKRGKLYENKVCGYNIAARTSINICSTMS